MWSHIIQLIKWVCILCFFIDDYSCKSWIYFLKGIDEFFSKFKEFKASVENRTRNKIKALQSYNGHEFASYQFKDICREYGIKREMITPYNPQQNGITERKNGTIMEVTKVMVHDQELPMHLWVEVARTVVYVQNRIPRPCPR